ncbi:MAG: photosynthetic reaction center subunit H [Myxococcota bacterium]
MFLEFTQYIDLAQVCLYIFWLFFFCLVYWLRKEDRREGYPTEEDYPRRIGRTTNILFPSPKTFLTHEGGTYMPPDFVRDDREIKAKRVAQLRGAPYEPVGDPMLAEVGPGSYAERQDTLELSIEGHPVVVPMRKAEGYKVAAGPDVRGWKLIAGDGEEAGVVTDIWVDIVDMVVRYLEVEIGEGDDKSMRLVPMPLVRVYGEEGVVKTTAIYAKHFAQVPTTKEAETITTLEEEKIGAFFAGGLLYADEGRLGPAL